MPSTQDSTTTATTSTVTKTQPWKANWPPKSEVVAGETHGFKKGEKLHLEGSAAGHPPPTVVKKEK